MQPLDGAMHRTMADSWVTKSREVPFRRIVPNWWWLTCFLLGVVATATIWFAWGPGYAFFGIMSSWVVLYLGPGRWDPR